MIPETIDRKYYSIGDLAKELRVATSLLRYWEKEFHKYIKPDWNKAGERVYSQKQKDIVHRIYFLVKIKGFTLSGARRQMAELSDDVKMKDFLYTEFTTITMGDRTLQYRPCWVRYEKNPEGVMEATMLSINRIPQEVMFMKPSKK